MKTYLQVKLQFLIRSLFHPRKVRRWKEFVLEQLWSQTIIVSVLVN